MIQLLQHRGCATCAKYVMIRRLNASSCPVDMLELVKDVPQESKILGNLVRAAERGCPQYIVSICNISYNMTQLFKTYCQYHKS